MSELDDSVELLDRALAYTRVALGDVRPDLLSRGTPCGDWSLTDLLAHMDDALDAFTEAAAGLIEIQAVPPASTRVETLRDKACALLGAWAEHRPAEAVRVGDLQLSGPVLVATAALEITVHGWDVSQATGRRTPLPPALVDELLPVAHAVLQPQDRPGRFDPPLDIGPAAAADARLLAFLGRPHPDPRGAIVTPGDVPRGRAS